MTKPVITSRTTKGAALTYSELDTNFANLRDATVTIKAGTAGTEVVTDLNGTLTLVAGTNVTLTGDNTAKTITINASSGGDLTSDLINVGQPDGDQVVLRANTTNSSGKSLKLEAQNSGIPFVSNSYLQIGGGSNGSTGSTTILKAGNGSRLTLSSENAVIIQAFPYSDVIITPGEIGIPQSDGRIRLNGPLEIQGTTGSPSNTTTPSAWLKLGVENPTARTAKTITNNGVTITADNLNGSGILLFNNSTDRLSLASTSDFAFGTGDFCVESWVYRNVIDVEQHVFDFRTSTSDTGIKLEVYINSSNQVVVKVAGTVLLSGGTILTGSGWSSIAVSRYNSTTTLHVAGSPVASVSDTNNYVSASLTIGNSCDIASPFSGNLDEIRISKGIARYSSGSYTPDRQPFIDDGYTVLLIHGDTSIADDAVSGASQTYYLPLYQ